MLNGHNLLPTANAMFARTEPVGQPADFDHAVVIGGSIAGLTAARVLADYFNRVTIVERDHFPGDVEFRHGAPQARHAHMLLPRGLIILEQQFPGLTADLLQSGAVAIRPGRDVLVFNDRDWDALREKPDQLSLASSRPLLEYIVRRHLVRHSHVQILEGMEVTGLQMDQQRRRVRGVELRSRNAATRQQQLAASVVLDASGRGSRAPQWLQQMDFCPPQEWTVNAFVGYTTRLYRRPPDFDESWKALHVRLSPPDHTRGGLIVPLEGGRWQVALVGIARDHPPTDEDGFLAFARSLPTSRLYEAIVAAEPLTRPFGYRHTANRMRRFDRMRCYLEGFLVGGDAAYTLNPVYALGMTAAVAAAPALEYALQQHAGWGNVDGLSATFQRQLDRAIAPYWRLATRNDWNWPETEIEDNELFEEME